MSKRATLPLESYRLAQYSIHVPCYVCEEGNSFDAEFCRHCFAPMALAHQANTQKVEPLMVAALGPAAVGKTVYLGMLMDMLSRAGGPLELLARGAFSINLQQNTMSALSRCEFPDKTPNEPDRWNWVHCQIRSAKRRNPLELMMPDMAGEAIFEEMDHPYSYRVIRAILLRCSGAIVLVDADRSDRVAGEQDYFTMKMLSYLSELSKDNRRMWRNRPVAVVFTKSDLCDSCMTDPVRFAKEHTRGLWKHCQERFNRHRFFAASVTGMCAMREEFGGGTASVPLRIEPRGIIEPFEWLLNQIKV